VVTLELPYPPSVNAIWRYAGRSAYISKQYAAWKKEADAWFMKQKAEKTVGTPIKGAFEVHMAFSDRKRRKNADLDNRIKVVNDALQRFGLIENDSKCEKLTATWAPVECGVFIRVFKSADTSESSSSRTT
jgi:Holliday junction resolvase RusA-like endonuclease